MVCEQCYINLHGWNLLKSEETGGIIHECSDALSKIWILTNLNSSLGILTSRNRQKIL